MCSSDLNRGSGYPTIKMSLEKTLMGKPIVRSTLDEFDILFRHRRMTEGEGYSYSRANVEEAILSYFAEHESASSSEVAKAVGMTMKTVRRYLSRLVEDGTLEPIETKNSPKRRYRLG